MSEMIDQLAENMVWRVAAAIRRGRFARTGRAAVFDAREVSELDIADARAAIEAMRQANDEMDLAGAEEVDASNPYPRDVAENVWTRMIDTALKDTPPS